MRKNLARVAIGAVLAMVIAVIGASSASALFRTTNRSNTYYDIATAVQFQFRTQDDGDGIRVEDFWLNTNRGCDSLESDGGGKYSEVVVFMEDKTTGEFFGQVNFGQEGCDVYKDMEFPGTDQGCMNVKVSMKARVNFRSDKRLYWGYTFCPNPERSDFLYTLVLDA